jgi:hypothetical protein
MQKPMMATGPPLELVDGGLRILDIAPQSGLATYFGGDLVGV